MGSTGEVVEEEEESGVRMEGWLAQVSRQPAVPVRGTARRSTNREQRVGWLRLPSPGLPRGPVLIISQHARLNPTHPQPPGALGGNQYPRKIHLPARPPPDCLLARRQAETEHDGRQVRTHVHTRRETCTRDTRDPEPLRHTSSILIPRLASHPESAADHRAGEDVG